VKLSFAAPANFFSAADLSHEAFASVSHFFIKLVMAAPASFLLPASILHESAYALPQAIKRAVIKISPFIVLLLGSITFIGKTYGAAIQTHIPAAFLRLLHSLQYFGQVVPAGTFPAALSAFQSAPQARSRAYSACRPSAGFFVAAGAVLAVVAGAAGAGVVVVAAAGCSVPALHLATYAFSVILAASFAALFALHSSWQAFTVFFCANEGVAENAKPEKTTAKHTMSIDGLFMSRLQFVLFGSILPRAGKKRSALSEMKYTEPEYAM
jgi:hypothetical protein